MAAMAMMMIVEMVAMTTMVMMMMVLTMTMMIALGPVFTDALQASAAGNPVPRWSLRVCLPFCKTVLNQFLNRLLRFDHAL